MSSYYFGNFYCEDQDSEGACTVQCALCKLRTPKGGDIDPRTDKEKLQAIRRKQLSQLSH